MFKDDQLVQDLGVQDLTPEEQQNVIDMYRLEVGKALAQDLSEEQIQEYEAIINGDQAVIDSWLGAHAPHFKDSEMYKALALGYEDDPEKVPADKAYASLAWIQMNNPNFAHAVAEVKDKITSNIDQYK